jgi:hypothetical protein
MADSDTLEFIACLSAEHNSSQHPAWQAAKFPGKIVGGVSLSKTIICNSERPGTTRMFTFSDRVVVPIYVLIRHLDGESVLLNLETEKYFGLDGTGTRMWEVATQAPTVEAAYAKLSEEFDVEPNVLRNHLAELLGQLVENGLLKVMPADVESIPAV